jgi:hypothetical protein
MNHALVDNVVTFTIIVDIMFIALIICGWIAGRIEKRQSKKLDQ